MLWFLKGDGDNEDDGKRTSRKRRRSTGADSSKGADRPDPADIRRRRRSSRRSSRSDTSRSRTREDTRDRDIARRKKRRSRKDEEEQREVFAAISFDDEEPEIDPVEGALARALNTIVYVLIGALVLVLAVYGVHRAVSASRAGQVQPLQEAAEAGDIGTLRELISAGGPVDGVGPEGGTPLAAAIRSGQHEAVQLLLGEGAEPTPEAMRLAMRHRRWQTIASLVEAGADPDVRGGWDGRSSLELATENGKRELIVILLEHGADPDAVGHAGPSAQPALHHAAQHNMTDIVELLLEYGADPTTEWFGYRPRHLAEDNGHEKLARLLREAETRDRSGL